MSAGAGETILAVLGWWFTALLALLFVVCILAARGRIPLNRVFGLKLPALLRGPAAWRAGHKAAIMPSLLALLVAAACALVGLTAPLAYWGSIAAFVIGVAWAMSAGSRAARAVAPDSAT